MLPGIRLTQDGDYEFIGEIPESLVRTALFKVLRVKRFKATKGVSRSPEAMAGLLKYRQERRENRLKRAAGGAVGVGGLPGGGDANQYLAVLRLGNRAGRRHQHLGPAGRLDLDDGLGRGDIGKHGRSSQYADARVIIQPGFARARSRPFPYSAGWHCYRP